MASATAACGLMLTTALVMTSCAIVIWGASSLSLVLFEPGHQGASQFGRIVSPWALLVHHVGGDDLVISARRGDQGNLAKVPLRLSRLEGVVDQHIRKEAGARVALNSGDVVAHGIPVRLASLSGDVANIDL